jgi:hypothetical protein
VVKRPRALAQSRAAVLATLFVLGWALRVGLPGIDLTGIRFHHQVHSLRLSEMLAMVAALLFIRAGPLALPKLRSSLGTFAAAAFLLAGVAAASSLWAPHPRLALLQGAHLAIWVAFAVVVAMVQVPPRRMAAAFVVGLLVHVVVGLAQAVTQRNVGLWALGELQIRPGPPWSTITDGEWQILRVYGLSSHPNVLAGHFAVGLALCLGLASGRRPVARTLVGVTGTLLFVTLLLTFSRAGLLAAALGMAVSALWMSGTGTGRRISGLAFRLSVCGAIAIGLFAWALNWHRSFGTALTDLVLRPAGATERFGLIHAAVRLMAEHPLGGVGARNFSAATQAITPDHTMLDSVHSIPLLIGGELGLAGLIPAAVVVGVLLAVACRHWRARSVHLWHGPVAGGLAALALASLLDHYPWTVPQGGLLWAWLTGWWLTEDATEISRQPRAEPRPPARPAVRSA